MADDKPQFVEGYRNPDGGPLQIWPRLTREDFDSEDDFWAWMDEIQRFNVRLASPDYELLVELANSHAVKPGTMARILMTRGVRAAI